MTKGNPIMQDEERVKKQGLKRFAFEKSKRSISPS